MNKQELIDKLKRHLKAMSEVEGSEYDEGYEYAIKQHLAMIAELDEPEKPVVPQFVADWYEEYKSYFEYNLHSLCIDFHERKLQKDLHEWFNNLSNKPIETLVMMHQLGYEVKKEKLYEVFLKRTGAQLGVCVPHGEDKTQFTKVELQEYDFDNLDAFEIKEVEE